MRRWPTSNVPRPTPVAPTLADYVSWVDTTTTGDAASYWKKGITYRVLCGNADSTYDNCVITGSGDANPEKAATSAVEFRGASAFTIFGEIDCSPVGFWDDAERLTAEQFTLVESRELENIFWTGEVHDTPGIQFPHLAADTEVLDPLDDMILLQPAAEEVTTAAVSAAVALAAAEKYLGLCYSGVGTVLVGVGTFNALVEDLLIFRDAGGKFKTALGNWVVPMRGVESLTGPDGSAPAAGTEWLYITGQIFGYRGTLQQVGNRVESFNRGVNTEKMIVERTYVLAWDCCLGAAEVDITP